MPLPDLPPNNTIRSWLKYTSGGVPHELCLRFPVGTTNTDIIASNVDIATALKPWIGTADAFTALRSSAAGSNLSFPLAWAAVAGTNITAYNDQLRAMFVALAGRSAGGYRCRVTFFSPFWGTSNDFRGPTSGASASGALYQSVVGLEPDAVAIDGLSVVWNGYTNQGFNSYWQRQLR